jgi:hypothetical protein
LLVFLIGNIVFYIPTLITNQVARISPNKKFALWWIAINFIVQAVGSIYTIFETIGYQYIMNHKLLFLGFIILLIAITYNSILGAYILYKSEENKTID